MNTVHFRPRLLICINFYFRASACPYVFPVPKNFRSVMVATTTNEFGQTIGVPAINWTPREMPPAVVLSGRYVTLEPLNPAKHTPDLWEAFSEGNASDWTYLFADSPETYEAMLSLYGDYAMRQDLLTYVIISGKTGKAVGTMSYMNAHLMNGDIEIGSIHFGRQLRRSRLATKAIYLIMSRVLDDLGYLRFVWKCDALNGPSRAAAKRFGFTFEGVHRNHMFTKGRFRDTAWFSIIADERRDAFEAWLNPDNFDENEQQKRKLEEFMPASGNSFSHLL